MADVTADFPLGFITMAEEAVDLRFGLACAEEAKVVLLVLRSLEMEEFREESKRRSGSRKVRRGRRVHRGRREEDQESFRRSPNLTKVGVRYVILVASLWCVVLLTVIGKQLTSALLFFLAFLSCEIIWLFQSMLDAPFFLRFWLMLEIASPWIGSELIVFDVIFPVIGLPLMSLLVLVFKIWLLLSSLVASLVALPFAMFATPGLDSVFLLVSLLPMLPLVYVCGVILLELWPLLSRALRFFAGMDALYALV
ncbi:hypothetical protein YC2023_076762 [Brassica napus]